MVETTGGDTAGNGIYLLYKAIQVIIDKSTLTAKSSRSSLSECDFTFIGVDAVTGDSVETAISYIEGIPGKYFKASPN